MKIYFDAGYTKLNSPPVFLAYAVEEKGKEYPCSRVLCHSGVASSCEAEYRALVNVLNDFYVVGDYLLEDKLTFYGDNETLMKQLNGEYEIKNPVLKELYEEILDYVSLITESGVKIEFIQVPREKNKADKYVRESKKLYYEYTPTNNR